MFDFNWNRLVQNVQEGFEDIGQKVEASMAKTQAETEERNRILAVKLSEFESLVTVKAAEFKPLIAP